MNRFRLLALGTMLLFALTTVAQQAASSSTKATSGGDHAGVPTAEVQLKFLATNLDLTADQQEKIKPILREVHDATVKLVQDKSMSGDDSLAKVRELRYAADKKIRIVLTEDQKKKLDQVEQEPHPELHGDVSGSNR